MQCTHSRILVDSVRGPPPFHAHAMLSRLGNGRLAGCRKRVGAFSRVIASHRKDWQ